MNHEHRLTLELGHTLKFGHDLNVRTSKTKEIP